MQDFKSKAAGDDAETSQRNDSNKPRPADRDFCVGALETLEAFTGKKLNDEEAELWIQRLLKYPRWKLLQLYEYTGTLSNDVFKYLDSIHEAPQSVREALGYVPAQLPEPENEVSRKTQLARDTLAHINKMLEYCGNGKMTPEQLVEKRQIEREGLEVLHAKYAYVGFDSVLREERLKF
jgi:hypothetical protein